MKKITAKELVAANSSDLASMTNKQLFDFSRAHGIDSASGFSAFKKALLTIGIDYAGRRSESNAAKIATITAAATASLTLFTDAKARTNRFAICDAAGQPVWYGKFFDDDRDYNGEQSSGEMCAAKKAVYLATLVMRAIGATGIRLLLKTDAEWLSWANIVASDGDNGKRGGRARDLAQYAHSRGILLEVEHIPGVTNPADKFTICRGFQSYKDANLRALIA